MSLFNDGVIVVVFTANLAIASGGGEVGPLHVNDPSLWRHWAALGSAMKWLA